MALSKTRRKWNAIDIAILREFYPHYNSQAIAVVLNCSVRRVYQKATALGLKKSQAYLDSESSGRLLKGIRRSPDTEFKKGLVPWNKGKKIQAHPNAIATQFKKGNKPHTWKPVGSERISKDGYLQRKVSDTGYPPRDWIGVHILLWQKHHGPVPDGHAIVFKDGDKQNICIENLECLSRAELMRRNSIHYTYPKEIVQLVQLRGALNRKINRAERKKHE